MWSFRGRRSLARSSATHSSEAARLGRAERKLARTDPSVVVVAVRRESDPRVWVGVLPITHAAQHPDRGVTLPAKVKRHLGLDDDASWIVLDEANEFVWPGVDLRPISRTRPGVWTYGVLPREVFEDVWERLRLVLDQRRVRRDE